MGTRGGRRPRCGIREPTSRGGVRRPFVRVPRKIPRRVRFGTIPRPPIIRGRPRGRVPEDDPFCIDRGVPPTLQRLVRRGLISRRRVRGIMSRGKCCPRTAPVAGCSPSFMSKMLINT